MNIHIENNYSLGKPTLFSISANKKKVYAPCTLCKNTRKIVLSDEEGEYSAECPKCSNKQIKGDSNNTIFIKKYKVIVWTINKIEIEKWGSDLLVNYCMQGKDESKHSYNKVLTQQDLDNLGEDTLGEYTSFYTDEKQVLDEVKKLNLIEKKKEKEFITKFGEIYE